MLKTRCFNGLLAVLLLLTVERVNTQTQPKAITDLMKLEGHWEAKATLLLDGKSYSFSYHASFKKSYDQSGVYMEEWATVPELGKLMGTNLIGFNANDGKIHWFSVDNFGTTHDHLGTWKTPEHFYMQANEIVQKKQMVEKIDLTFMGTEKMELRLVSTLGGKETERLTATFQRVLNCTE